VDPAAPRGPPPAQPETPEHLLAEKPGLTPTPSILRNAERKTMTGRITGLRDGLKRFSARLSVSGRRPHLSHGVLTVAAQRNASVDEEERLREDPDFPVAQYGKLSDQTLFARVFSSKKVLPADSSSTESTPVT
jgi:hypothetical protein